MKSAIIDPQTRAAKTVLEVRSVVGGSGMSRDAVDLKASDFLQSVGFMQLKKMDKGMYARVPGGENLFLVEYDNNDVSNSKPFKLVSLSKGVCRLIESGYTIYVQATPGQTGPIEIACRGDALTNWTLNCVAAERAAVEAYRSAVAKDGIQPRKCLSAGGDSPSSSGFSDDEPVDSDGDGELPPDKPSPRFTIPDPPAPPKPKPVPQRPKVEEVHLPALLPAPPVVIHGNGGSPLVEDPHERPPHEGAIKAGLDEIVAFQANSDAPQFSGQPRKHFDTAKLQELADSIKEEGQQQAVIVKRIEGIAGVKYEIISGERRWRACRLAGKTFVWVAVRKTRDKKDQHLSAMIENLHRVPNTDLEIAHAIQEQIKAGETIVSITKALGKGSRQAIYNYLSLLKLHPDLQALMDPPTLKEKRIKQSVAVLVARAPMDKQMDVWQEAKKQPTRGLVFRRLHQLVKEFHGDRVKKHGVNNPSNIARDVERRLNRLDAVLLELGSFSHEELRTFAAFKGSDASKLFADRLTEAERTVLGIRQKLSQARFATKPVAIPA